MRTFEGKTSNQLLWSPKGRHVLVATLGSNSKFDIEFWDLDLDKEGPSDKEEKDPGSGIKLITAVEHFGMTQVEWDPSGRYVASFGSTWMTSLEPGYRLWDWKGQDLEHRPTEKFRQFLWRPRPPTLLSKDDQRRIRRNLREYSRQFEEQDALEESNVSAELIALRQRLVEEWNAWRERSKARVDGRRKELGLQGRAAVVRAEQSKVAEEEVEEWLEEVIEETTEEVAA